MNSHSPHSDLLAAGPSDAELEQMKEHDISCDGTSYFFSGYRYAKLADALSYARLMRERPELPSRGHAVATSQTSAAPTEASRELMAKLGIDLDAGVFRFGGFRYDRLEDAVAYAKLTSRRCDSGPEQS